MTVHTTSVKKTILELMFKDKRKLFSVEDIEEITKLDHSVVDNSIRQIRITGEIFRHIDKDVDNHHQYAVTISDNKIEKYVKSKTMGLSNGARKTKRKSSLPSSKEIRSMFSANITNLSKLEDLVMVVILRCEELEKEMDKIKRAVNI